MITQLRIEHYRGIQNLQLDDLARVNIIAGGNNVGKTSILEVIRSIQNPQSKLLWRTIGMRSGNRMDINTYEALLQLFPQNDYGALSIKYNYIYKNQSKAVEIRGDIEKVFATRAELEEIPDRFIREQDYEEMETEVLELDYWIDNESIREDSVANVRGFRCRESVSRGTDTGVKVVYVSPTQHANSIEERLEEIFNGKSIHDEFVRIMRQFDPYFHTINLVNNSKNRGKRYVVFTENREEGLSLDSYGDGMKKAMVLVSSLLKARGGVLLLDEFETAIHISAMKELFGWILKVAKELDVQIFMTSHSLEAITTVLRVAEEPDDIRMLTLLKRDSDIRVRNVNGLKAIELLDQYGLELR